MRSYDAAAQPIIFLHIPKTAGTTVSEILRRQYPPEAIFEGDFNRPQVVARFEALSPAEKRRFKLFRGHLPFGFAARLTRPASYFSFLRHPVDRVLSHYYYVRSRPDLFELDGTIAGDGLSLHEVIERRLIVDINNVQTRYLAGLPHLFPADQYCDAHLAAAQQNLARHVAVVGLVEHFDASLLLLRRAFGWRHVYYQRRNVTPRPGRDEIAPETVALIERQEAYDMALYQFAQQRFAAQVAAHGPSFARALARFQRINRFIYAPLTRLRARFMRSTAGRRRGTRPARR